MPAKTERKILAAGTSRAITLPPDWLRAMKLDKGDTIEILYDFIVLIKPMNAKLDLAFLNKELEILARLRKVEPR